MLRITSDVKEDCNNLSKICWKMMIDFKSLAFHVCTHDWFACTKHSIGTTKNRILVYVNIISDHVFNSHVEKTATLWHILKSHSDQKVSLLFCCIPLLLHFQHYCNCVCGFICNMLVGTKESVWWIKYIVAKSSGVANTAVPMQPETKVGSSSAV